MLTDAVHTAEITKLRLEDKNKLEKGEEEEGKKKTKKHGVVRANIFLSWEAAKQLL
jgi:hypothetical protein